MKKIVFYIIIIQIVIVTSCYKEEDYKITNISPDEVILNIIIENDTILANGNSSTKILVEIPLEADETKSAVTIVTSNGKFEESDTKEITKNANLVTVDDNNRKIAEFILLSSNISGDSKLEIKVGEFKKEQIVHFKYNYPNLVRTTPSKLFINPINGEEIEIICKLFSNNGLPSKGQKVDLVVKDSLLNNIGSFRIYNSISNILNECNFTYTILPDTAYSGKLLIISSSIVENEILADTVKIYTLN